MSKKTIKIPQGEFTLMFERGNLCSTITDEMLIDFIRDGVYKMANPEPQETTEIQQPLTYEESFDDENPNYIKSSQEEI